MHADAVAKRGLDCLRRLLHDPSLLAADSPTSGFLAFTKTLALSDSLANMDGNVGDFGGGDCAVAWRIALRRALGVDSGGRIVGSGILTLQTLPQTIHAGAIRRTA